MSARLGMVFVASASFLNRPLDLRLWFPIDRDFRLRLNLSIAHLIDRKDHELHPAEQITGVVADPLLRFGLGLKPRHAFHVQEGSFRKTGVAFANDLHDADVPIVTGQDSIPAAFRGVGWRFEGGGVGWHIGQVGGFYDGLLFSLSHGPA